MRTAGNNPALRPAGYTGPRAVMATKLEAETRARHGESQFAGPPGQSSRMMHLYSPNVANIGPSLIPITPRLPSLGMDTLVGCVYCSAHNGRTQNGRLDSSCLVAFSHDPSVHKKSLIRLAASGSVTHACVGPRAGQTESSVKVNPPIQTSQPGVCGARDIGITGDVDGWRLVLRTEREERCYGTEVSGPDRTHNPRTSILLSGVGEGNNGPGAR
ncbi:hypothetical protein Bbelb_179140 [Branchiostoma belcheri]|nr:hypothetical protein Bbelb_179140 [Branchiostoma belcheri]